MNERNVRAKVNKAISNRFPLTCNLIDSGDTDSGRVASLLNLAMSRPSSTFIFSIVSQAFSTGAR